MTYEPKEFIKILLDKAKALGFAEAEAFYESGSSTELQILEGEVSMYESSALQGVSFRGSMNHQMGYAFVEELTDDSIAFLLESAAQNCAVLESEEEETIYAGDKEYRRVQVYAKDLDQLTFDDFSKIGLELEHKVKQSDERIVAVDHCFVSYGSSISQIANTLGLTLSHESNMVFVYADARCEENNQVKTGDGYWFGRDLKELDIDALATKVAKTALDKLGAASMASGKYNIVLDAAAAADLMAVFSGVFSADLIQKGLSLLGDKINTKIASDLVTIHDDAISDASITSIPFDSEGVSTQNKILVDKGVLTKVLHNRKTAAKAGLSSTGNGFRSGYKGSISIGSTNFYIEPGTLGADALLREAENGLYISELSGLHAGANIVSGDFSLSCEGFLIEDGRLGRAVDQVTLSENFYVLLNKIIAVGSDLFFNPPSDAGSIGSPSLLIKDIAISGE